MKIAIIGAGALGSVIGALLWEAGLDPVLIECNSDEVDHIRKNGLWIEGVSGDRYVRPRITNDPSTVGKADLVIVLVKSYDTKSSCSTVEKILSDDGAIITVQNGVGNFEILDAAFPGKVLMGVTTMGAMKLGVGRVRHTGYGPTHLGEVSGEITDRALAIRDVLKSMNGGPVNAIENAFGSVWSKLIINAGINAPATLLRLRNGDLPNTASGLALIKKIVKECVMIVEAKGIQLIFDDPEAQVIQVCKGTAGNLNSMFQDIIAGRKTEIDFINGAIAEQAKNHGLEAPVNETLAMLIRSMEATSEVRVSK
ncbi:MAG: ketopantoate reductase family protein [Deltaproteobacteria bacterium]|nr:ketopantoate reductase family protein [Deltaproteobacteria bacterium]